MAEALNINDENNGEAIPKPVYSEYLRQYFKLFFYECIAKLKTCYFQTE